MSALVNPLSLDQLESEADLVAQGKVLSKTCQRDSSGRIYTSVDLLVTDVWKGKVARSPLTIVHGGGTLGEEQSVVSNQVEYSVGEDVVAFLKINSDSQGVTVALAQGKFHIWQDASGAKFVHNGFHGHDDALINTNRSVLAKSRNRLTLRQLKEHVCQKHR